MHNRLYGKVLRQSPVQPFLEEGALMPLDNDSELGSGRPRLRLSESLW
jgi:hypothetical protein